MAPQLTSWEIFSLMIKTVIAGYGGYLAPENEHEITTGWCGVQSAGGASIYKGLKVRNKVFTYQWANNNDKM